MFWAKNYHRHTVMRKTSLSNILIYPQHVITSAASASSLLNGVSGPECNKMFIQKYTQILQPDCMEIFRIVISSQVHWNRIIISSAAYRTVRRESWPQCF